MLCTRVLDWGNSCVVWLCHCSRFFVVHYQTSLEDTLVLVLSMPRTAQVCVGALLGVLVGVFFPIPTAIAVA